MRCLFTKGEVRPKSEEKALFQRNLCYHTVKERIRLQEKKSLGIFTGQRGRKNHFLTTAPEVAA
jgi:hypothetical protein